MVCALHAWCGQPGSKTIQGTGSIRSEKAEQPTPGVQCRSACLHWRSTRAVRRTDCASESGEALSGDEARGPAARVGAHIWTQGLEKSFRNYVNTGFELLSHVQWRDVYGDSGSLCTNRIWFDMKSSRGFRAKRGGQLTQGRRRGMGVAYGHWPRSGCQP